MDASGAVVYRAGGDGDGRRVVGAAAGPAALAEVLVTVQGDGVACCCPRTQRQLRGWPAGPGVSFTAGTVWDGLSRRLYAAVERASGGGAAAAAELVSWQDEPAAASDGAALGPVPPLAGVSSLSRALLASPATLLVPLSRLLPEPASAVASRMQDEGHVGLDDGGGVLALLKSGQLVLYGPELGDCLASLPAPAERDVVVVDVPPVPRGTVTLATAGRCGKDWRLSVVRVGQGPDEDADGGHNGALLEVVFSAELVAPGPSCRVVAAACGQDGDAAILWSDGTWELHRRLLATGAGALPGGRQRQVLQRKLQHLDLASQVDIAGHSATPTASRKRRENGAATLRKGGAATAPLGPLMRPATMQFLPGSRYLVVVGRRRERTEGGRSHLALALLDALYGCVHAVHDLGLGEDAKDIPSLGDGICSMDWAVSSVFLVSTIFSVVAITVATEPLSLASVVGALSGSGVDRAGWPCVAGRAARAGMQVLGTEQLAALARPPLVSVASPRLEHRGEEDKEGGGGGREHEAGVEELDFVSGSGFVRRRKGLAWDAEHLEGAEAAERGLITNLLKSGPGVVGVDEFYSIFERYFQVCRLDSNDGAAGRQSRDGNGANEASVEEGVGTKVGAKLEGDGLRPNADNGSGANRSSAVKKESREQKRWRRAAASLSPALVSAVVRWCFTSTHWAPLRCLLEAGAVTAAVHPGLIAALVEQRHVLLLERCFAAVPDLPPSDLALFLKFVLINEEDNAGERLVPLVHNRQRQAAAVVAKAAAHMRARGGGVYVAGNHLPRIAREAVMAVAAVEGFSPQELCLHAVVAAPHVDEAVLSAAVTKLDAGQLSVMVAYLCKWVELFGGLLQSAALRGHTTSRPGFPIPSLSQVLAWASTILDAHFAQLVLARASLPHLLQLQQLVASQVALTSRLAPLAGAVAHMQDQQRQQGNSRNAVGGSFQDGYTVELLALH
eukprot:SM000163S02309  [mRNA]  locus=s163:89581:92838:+ [translate_table: standard]